MKYFLPSKVTPERYPCQDSVILLSAVQVGIVEKRKGERKEKMKERRRNGVDFFFSVPKGERG